MKCGHIPYRTARRAHLVAFLAVMLLAGCRFDLQPVENPSTATATLSPAAPSQPADTPRPATVTAVEAPSAEATATTVALVPTQDGTRPVTVTPWPNDTPTRGPSPTASRTPTRTRIPTRTLVPTRTRANTRTPTVTLTPTPPPPDHLILRPGLMSKVVSPIQVELYALSGDDGLVTVELIGEDGRIIARQALDYGRRRSVYAAPEIPFQIAAVSEVARLQVHSEDAFGRSLAISSVDLILLSVGRNEINPPALTEEPFVIRSPRPNTEVSGGMLIVEGVARPVNDSTLVLELTNEAGAVISTKTFTVDPPPPGQSHTPYRLEIPYAVSTSTPVCLSIRQEADRIPGTAALNSISITLNP